MMFKRVSLFFLIFCLTFQLLEMKSFAATTNNSKVLIVYDRKTIFGYKHDLLSEMEELMGAFNRQVDTINITDYTSSTLDKYDYVFILSIDKDFNNKNFIKDAQKYEKKLCIIGRVMESFLSNTKKYDLIYSGDKANCNQVFYSSNRDFILQQNKMDKFYLQDNETFPTIKTTSSAAKVLSYVSDGFNYYPFAINEANLWWLSALDDNSILSYIFSDILNDIFQRGNIPQNQVVIRMEDVNPSTDINKLKVIANYFYSEQIPFVITLMPSYTDPKTNNITTLSESRDFIQAILYMQNKGGSVVLQEMNDYTDDEIGEEISNCVENGIYPLGFAVPSYEMNSKGYLHLKSYFSTYVGEFQSKDGNFTGNNFPYELYATKYFNKLVPENLGSIDPVSPMTLTDMEESLRKVSMVRGYTAGLSFQSNLNMDYLKSIASYLKSKDITFLNLKNEKNWVKFRNLKITSENGSINVQGKVESKNNQPTISTLNIFIIILVSIFCSIFIILIVMSRKIYRNKYYR